MLSAWIFAATRHKHVNKHIGCFYFIGMEKLNYTRTISDALEIIVHAKHTPDEVLPTTQVFYYPSAEEFQNTAETFRLIDVDEKFIALLEDGERFVFRGTGDEKLVLCSDDVTYEVKEGEVSNCLVLAPDLQFSGDLSQKSGEPHRVITKQICGIFNSYLELRPTFPKINKLRYLLNEARFKGPEEEDERSGKGYYICDLLEVIQCSRNELMDNLRDLAACCIDGRWRFLDVEYQTRVLSYIINLAEEKSWTELPKAECIRILKNVVPPAILEHTFDYYLENLGEDTKYRWRESELCRSFAEMLLRAGEGKFRYNEFMMAWKQCVPHGVEPDLKCLRGLALMEQEGTQQQVIHMFTEESLPENIPERFRLLFKRKEKWTLEEIQPYIEKLATKGMNVSTMLTKFARPSTQNGVRVFGSKHIK